MAAPSLESAERNPLEVFQPAPQPAEGRGEGVVSTGNDLINFDSITPAMATTVQSQVFDHYTHTHAHTNLPFSCCNLFLHVLEKLKEPP